MPENTVEAYEALFRGNLHGCWDNSVFTFSPADTSISFNPNGSGHCMAGADGMFSGGFDFKWRQVGDFEIEVSLDGSKWSKITYGFYEGNAGLWAFFASDNVHIMFDSVNEREEWLSPFCTQFLPLAMR